MASDKIVTCHLLVESKDGKIPTKPHSEYVQVTGDENVMMAVACDPKSALPKHATGETSCVTCLKCIETEAFRKLLKEQYSEGVPRTLAVNIQRVLKDDEKAKSVVGTLTKIYEAESSEVPEGAAV